MYTLMPSALCAPAFTDVDPLLSIWNTTPGTVSANSRKLRDICGTDSICCSEIVVPTSEVFTSARRRPVTVTSCIGASSTAPPAPRSRVASAVWAWTITGLARAAAMADARIGRAKLLMMIPREFYSRAPATAHVLVTCIVTLERCGRRNGTTSTGSVSVTCRRKTILTAQDNWPLTGFCPSAHRARTLLGGALAEAERDPRLAVDRRPGRRGQHEHAPGLYFTGSEQRILDGAGALLGQSLQARGQAVDGRQ